MGVGLGREFIYNPWRDFIFKPWTAALKYGPRADDTRFALLRFRSPAAPAEADLIFLHQQNGEQGCQKGSGPGGDHGRGADRPKMERWSLLGSTPPPFHQPSAHDTKALIEQACVRTDLLLTLSGPQSRFGGQNTWN